MCNNYFFIDQFEKLFSRTEGSPLLDLNEQVLHSVMKVDKNPCPFVIMKIMEMIYRISIACNKQPNIYFTYNCSIFDNVKINAERESSLEVTFKVCDKTNVTLTKQDEDSDAHILLNLSQLLSYSKEEAKKYVKENIIGWKDKYFSTYEEYQEVFLKKNEDNSVKQNAVAISREEFGDCLNGIEEEMTQIEADQLPDGVRLSNLLSNIPSGILGVIYPSLFMDAFLVLCHSVLTSEYTMIDSFSEKLIKIKKGLQPNNNMLTNEELGDSDSFFLEIRPLLIQLLSDYINFNTFIDSQIDKDPSSILKRSNEIVNRQYYETSLDEYFANNTDLFPLMQALVCFFHELLEMTRIDQNYYFSMKRFCTLLYLNEVINDEKEGLLSIFKEKNVTIFLPKAIVSDMLSMLSLVDLKNKILISKIMDSCQESVRDLVYDGLSKKYVFDPRKCYDQQPGKEEIVKLLKISDFFLDRKDNDLIDSYYLFTSDEADEELDKKKLFEYERRYIKSIHDKDKNESIVDANAYYKEALPPMTGVTSTDIRHYNTKVLQMGRCAVKETAELRAWIKFNRFNYNEVDGFDQVGKVLSYFQQRYAVDVCYDYRMMVDYAKWCVDFLNVVACKAPTDNPRNEKRPANIETALLLLETILRMIKRLIKAIYADNYCVPFATKFKGCYYGLTGGKFVRMYDRYGSGNVFFSEEVPFDKFVAGEVVDLSVRKNILFVASTFVPPMDFEKLNKDYRDLRDIDKRIRNEIHAVYFEKIREYIRHDIQNKMEENRKSVIQILGVFAAFLALTTVAVAGSTSKNSDVPFLAIMFGFTICIGVFVLILHTRAFSNDREFSDRKKNKNRKKQENLTQEAQSIRKELETVEKDLWGVSTDVDVKNMDKFYRRQDVLVQKTIRLFRRQDKLEKQLPENKVVRNPYAVWLSVVISVLAICLSIIIITVSNSNSKINNKETLEATITLK